MSRAHIQALVAIALLGTVPMTVKGIGANPWTIGIVRLLIATACVLVFLRGSREILRHRSEWRQLLLIGLAFGLHWATYFVSIKTADASVAAIGTATYGVHVAFLGRFMLGHVPNRLQVVSILFAVAGAVLVVGGHSLSSDMTGGFLIAVVSAILYAFVPVLHQRNLHVPVDVRTLAQYVFALPVFLISLPATDWDLEPLDWAGMLHLSIIATFIAHSLYIRATSVLPTHITGILFYLYVPVAMLLCNRFLGEEIGWQRMTGAGLIVFASVLGVASEAGRKGAKAGVEAGDGTPETSGRD